MSDWVVAVGPAQPLDEWRRRARTLGWAPRFEAAPHPSLHIYGWAIPPATPALSSASTSSNAWIALSYAPAARGVDAAEGPPPPARGPCASAHWSDHHHALTLERDPLGLLPLWFVREALDGRDVLLASTAPRAILRLLQRPPRPSPSRLLAFLGGVNDPSRDGLLEPLQRVLPGEKLRWRPGRPLEIVATWEPAAGELVTGVEAVTRHARAAFDEAIAAHSPSGAPATVLMSGGLDSTAVAAVLSRRYSASNPLQVLSIVSDALPSYDERARIGAIERALPVRAHRFPVDALWPLQDPAFYETEWEFGPHPHPGSWPETQAIRAAVVCTGAHTVLTGVGAESCFGAGATTAMLGLLARRRWGAAWSERAVLGTAPWARGLAVGAAQALGVRAAGARVERFVRSAASAMAEPWALTRWLTDGARAQLGSLEGEEASSLSGANERETLARGTRGWLNDLSMQRVHAQGRAAGVRIAHPFLDPVLWQQALRIAPEWRHRGGYDKVALRLAMHGNLPHEVCWGPKRGTTERLAEVGMFRREAPRALELLRTSRLAALGLVHPARLRRAYDRAREISDARWPSAPTRPPVALWSALAAELWLRALEGDATAGAAPAQDEA